jgi:hypothetical protein
MLLIILVISSFWALLQKGRALKAIPNNIIRATSSYWATDILLAEFTLIAYYSLAILCAKALRKKRGKGVTDYRQEGNYKN